MFWSDIGFCKKEFWFSYVFSDFFSPARKRLMGIICFSYSTWSLLSVIVFMGVLRVFIVSSYFISIPVNLLSFL